MSADAFVELARYGSSLVGDALDRLNGLRGLVRYDGWGGCMVGPAFTVKTREGDNLALLQAIDEARPGDVLVVDGGGFTGRAIVGDLAREFALSHGLAGFVIDGALRDARVCSGNERFGCFAKGTSPNGPFKDGPGRINLAVAVGGQVIAPGDILVADDDGIVSFAAGQLGRVLDIAAKRAVGEDVIRSQIQGGRRPQPWLEAIIGKSGPVAR